MGGCSGSKTAEKTASAPVGDFQVTLERPGGDETLGVTVVSMSDNSIKFLTIKEEGLIPAWNKQNETTPELVIKEGDVIVCVNGVYVSSEAMKKELKEKTIALTLKRGTTPTPEADASIDDVAADEAAAADAAAAAAAAADAADAADAPAATEPVSEPSAEPQAEPIVPQEAAAEGAAPAEPAMKAQAASLDIETIPFTPRGEGEVPATGAQEKETKLCSLC